MIRARIRNWLLGAETREADPNLHPDSWLRISGPTLPGGVESNLSVAHRCVALQSQVLAGLPFAAYRRLPDGGRERIRSGSLAALLESPNPWQSRFDLVECIVRALHFAGNSFHEIERHPNGFFKALTPIPPSAVTPERTASGAIRYRVSAHDGRPARVLLDGEMLHVRNAGGDVLGVSTLQSARGVLGLAMELNNVAYAQARDGNRISGYVVQPALTAVGPKKAARDELKKQTTGAENAGGIAVLDPGVKFIPNQFSPEDAQLLGARQFESESVARVFNTPAGMCGITKSVSYGSAAQDHLNFVTTCLSPLASRIESAFERCLLSDESKAEVFFEFELGGLLRADPSERWRQYEIAKRIGAMSPNEIRRLENLPPREGGDAYEASEPAQSEQSE